METKRYLIKYIYSFNGQAGEGKTIFTTSVEPGKVEEEYLKTVKGDSLGKYETVIDIEPLLV